MFDRVIAPSGAGANFLSYLINSTPSTFLLKNNEFKNINCDDKGDLVSHDPSQATADSLIVYCSNPINIPYIRSLDIIKFLINEQSSMKNFRSDVQLQIYHRFIKNTLDPNHSWFCRSNIGPNDYFVNKRFIRRVRSINNNKLIQAFDKTFNTNLSIYIP